MHAMRIGFRGRKRKIIVSLLVLFLLGFAGAYTMGVFDKEAIKNDDPKKVYYSQLTGKEVDKEISEQPILGVMIENSEEARPQTGLDSAGIVFEAVTEGGITRYLALYQEDMPETVGPVRSLRPHFLDWLMGFDASVAHVGGSEDALELSDNRNAKSLSEFKYTEPYYRDNSREAPHNMYSKTKDLVELQKELKHKTSKFKEFQRKADSPSQTPETPKVEINFSAPLFKVEFRYDQATNTYTRYLAGSPHVDNATNKPITVKNVVVLISQGQLANGINAIGSGDALLFIDGKVQKAQWQKTSFEDTIEFTSPENAQVALNRGDSWFIGISNSRSVIY